MLGFFIAALLVFVCQNCKGAPVDAEELNEKELVEELQSQEGILYLRAFKESVSKSEDLESAWLAQLAEDMTRDSMSPSYNQKFDLLYDNHTDLNKPLKFDSVKLNCGKDFNIFRLLEQVKAHRKPANEGTPKCVECLLEDATCTTTQACPTAPTCTTPACPTTCPSKNANGAPRKSTSKSNTSKKREPLRHAQDFQHVKPDQIIKLISRQENPSNNSHGRRIPEGQGSKPGIQHFDPFPEKFDPFSQWRTAMASKLATNNEQTPGLANINPSTVERPNFLEPRKTEQNLKECRMEDQNAMPSKAGEQNIPLPNLGIQSSVTSKVDLNTVSSKVEVQNFLVPNRGDGVTNSEVQLQMPSSHLGDQNVLVKNSGVQNNSALNAGEQHAITAPKAEGQNAASSQGSSPTILTAKSLDHNSVISQTVDQNDQAPKAVSQVSIAPKTSEKNVVVLSMAVAHNLAANQEGGQKDAIGDQQCKTSKIGDQNSLVPKPGPHDSLVSTADGQNALVNKIETENIVALKDLEIIHKMEDHNAVPHLEDYANGVVNKPEDQNLVAHKSDDSNAFDIKTNVQISIEPKLDYKGVLSLGGDQNVIPNKVGDLNGEVQQSEDQHIVEPIQGEQIPLGYKMGGGSDNIPSMAEVILPKGGDQNDIAQKAGELFGLVPPNLETQNVIAPYATNILSPKSEDQNIFGSKSDDHNIRFKDHNAIAFRTGKRNTMTSNVRDQNAALNTRELNVNPLKTVHQNVIANLADDQNTALLTKDLNVDSLKIENQNIIAPQPGDQNIVETNINEVTQRIPKMQNLHEAQIDQSIIDCDLKKQPDLTLLQSLVLDKKLTNPDSSVGLSNNHHEFDNV